MNNKLRQLVSGLIIIAALVSMLIMSPGSSVASSAELKLDTADDAVVPMGGAVLNIFDDVVSESDGPAQFLVTRSGAPIQTITVSYMTVPGTAQSGVDFEPVSGVLTFGPFVTQLTIPVPILPDALYEEDETFFVALFDPSNNAIIQDGEGEGTILDDDDPPEINIENTSVTEGNTGNVTAVFPVTLSAASGLTVTVSYETSDDTAIAGLDYVAASGTATIPAGETSTTIEITVLPDTKDEFDETFFVNLSQPENADPGDMEGVGTIVDNDPPPSISIEDVTVVEGDAGNVTATFIVSLSAESGKTVSVLYATEDESAVAGVDYQATSGMLTFPPGDTSETIEVTVLGDLLDEYNETFLVNLSAPVNASPGDMEGVGTITDNDSPPGISIGDVTVTEGNAGNVTATFIVSLSAESGKTVFVSYATEDGTAVAGEDYQATSGKLIIPPGTTSDTIEVTVLGDLLDEENETFLANLSEPLNAYPADMQGVGTILDNDAAPTISIGNVMIMEGNAGNVTATFDVTLSAESGRTVSVSYATEDGTAVAGEDYQATSGMLTFPPGDTSATIEVTVLGDLLDEENETFLVNLSAPVNASPGDMQGVGTILDNDDPPTMDIADVTVTEGSGENSIATFVVALSAVSGKTITVNFATADGTAVAGTDYEAASGTLTILAGDSGGAIEVTVLGDLLDEYNETFLVNLSEPANATPGDMEATGTITDDDEPPVVGINDVLVIEGNSGSTTATFVVSLSAVSGKSITVSYATADGTAEAGEDYETANGTLTIPAGDSSGTIEVTVLGDLIDEPAAETFLVNLSNPQNATIGDGVGEGTIADDDGLPALFIAGVTVDEAAGTAGFSVTLIPASSFTVKVTYSTQDESARAGQDYTTKNGTLTLNPGQTQATIAVPIQDDVLDEDNETFRLVLSNPINAEVGMAQAQGTITDNDPLPTLAIDDIVVSEIAGAALFTVKLNVVSGREVRVNYATSNGTAISGVDFEARSGTLVIPAGSGQGMVEVPLNPDLPLAGQGVEGNEAFFITLSNPYRATIAQGEAEATVIDNALFMPMSMRPVAIDPCTNYEPNNNFTQASNNADITNEEGAVILGAFCADDPDDFYSIQVTTTAPEQTIQITLASVPANTDLDLYLYDATGSTLLAFSYSGLEGEAEEINYKIPASGEYTYFIRIYPYSAGNDAASPYQLTWHGP